jgi:hypothetical protein
VYILRGLEVVFAVFLVLVFVAWLKKQSSAAVAQTPVQPGQVLFDDGVARQEERVYGGREGLNYYRKLYGIPYLLLRLSSPFGTQTPFLSVMNEPCV